MEICRSDVSSDVSSCIKDGRRSSVFIVRENIFDIIIDAISQIKLKRKNPTAESIYNYLKKQDEQLDLSIFKFNLEKLVEESVLKMNGTGNDESYTFVDDSRSKNNNEPVISSHGPVISEFLGSTQDVINIDIGNSNL